MKKDKIIDTTNTAIVKSIESISIENFIPFLIKDIRGTIFEELSALNPYMTALSTLYASKPLDLEKAIRIRKEIKTIIKKITTAYEPFRDKFNQLKTKLTTAKKEDLHDYKILEETLNLNISNYTLEQDRIAEAKAKETGEANKKKEKEKKDLLFKQAQELADSGMAPEADRVLAIANEMAIEPVVIDPKLKSIKTESGTTSFIEDYKLEVTDPWLLAKAWAENKYLLKPEHMDYKTGLMTKYFKKMKLIDKKIPGIKITKYKQVR